MTGTSLTCSASGSDPDDGTLTPTYSWTVNGSSVGLVQPIQCPPVTPMLETKSFVQQL